MNAVLDDEAKQIRRLKFPKIPTVGPRKLKKPWQPRPPGYKVTSQKQLRALKRHAVPAGATLNPYGTCGDTFRARYRASYFGTEYKPAYREAAMRRKRAKLKMKNAIALEAHELQQIARENATLAMTTLAEIAGNPRAPEPSRIAASAVILDRAYGKASQTSITANVSNGKESEINSTELDKRITKALKRVDDLTNRAPKAGKSKNRPANLRLYN